VQVSKIETERLFTQSVRRELRRRAKEGNYVGKFSTQPHFFGYSGRSAFPSNFDSQYCYSLGYVAAVLIDAGLTGYMGCVRHLTKDVEEWSIEGIPLTTMMAMEQRHGKPKPVIKKALVDLNDAPFKYFEEHREGWKYDDKYRCPGPMQFYGPKEIAEATNFTLQLEHRELVLS
jgi:pyrophosphate--fructose-6-phosphate 1-phosphotransferase